jgi:hypothetical protein
MILIVCKCVSQRQRVLDRSVTEASVAAFGTNCGRCYYCYDSGVLFCVIAMARKMDRGDGGDFPKDSLNKDQVISSNPGMNQKFNRGSLPF